MEAEKTLRAARDEAYQAEARIRGDRSEFTQEARRKHVERRARMAEAGSRVRKSPETREPTDLTSEAGSLPQTEAAQRPLQGGTSSTPSSPAEGSPSPSPAQGSTPAAAPLPPGAPVPQAPVQPGPAGSSPAAASAAAGVSRSEGSAPAAPGSARTATPTTARTKVATPPPALPTPEPEPKAILDQVRLQLQPGMRQATLNLAPAHLGRIAIKMEVKDGEMTALVRVERPETLAALQANLPELKSMLAEAGLDTGSIDLGLSQDGSGDFQESGHNDDHQRASQRILATYYGDEGETREGATDLLVSGHVDLYA